MQSHLTRRILAHVTTPILVGIIWVLLVRDRRDDLASEMSGAVILCYAVWLLAGLPGLLARRRTKIPSLKGHVVTGALLGAALLAFPIALSLVSDGLAFWLKLGLFSAAIGATAGFWYWLCAYWHPVRSPIRTD